MSFIFIFIFFFDIEKRFFHFKLVQESYTSHHGDFAGNVATREKSRGSRMFEHRRESTYGNDAERCQSMAQKISGPSLKCLAKSEGRKFRAISTCTTDRSIQMKKK